jgi:hypothetical protein
VEGTNTRASVMGGLLSAHTDLSAFFKYELQIKELYCVSEATLKVLKFQL